MSSFRHMYLNSTLVTTEEILQNHKKSSYDDLNSTLVTTEDKQAGSCSSYEVNLNSTLVTTEGSGGGTKWDSNLRFKFYFSNN